jgi:hypothetical protein
MISKFTKYVGAFALLLVLVFPASSNAQSTKKQIEDLQKQIEILQQQNQQQIEALKQQIDQLQADRVADQEKVTKIVAESQKKDEDAWYNSFLAKYDKGFTFQSGDGNYKLRIRVNAQTQLSVNDTDEELTSTNFRVRRLQFRFDGNAFKPWFLYYIMFDAASSTILRDAYFTFAYQKEFSPRVGQWKVPFYKEELTSSTSLQLVERSIVNEEFTLERDRGLAVQGGLGANNNFSYALGVYNSDGLNGTSVDSNLLYAGRLQLGIGGDDGKFNPNGQFATARAYEAVPNFAKVPTFIFGAAVATLPGLDCARKTPNGQVCQRVDELGFPQSNFTTVTGDVNFKTAFFSVEGEYVGRWLSPDSGPQGTAYDQGFNVQSGVFVLPKTVELAGRFSYIAYDTSSSVVPVDTSVSDSSWAITPGLNYYLSRDHRWKVQVDYSFIRNTFTQGAPDIDENIFRAQLQAYF